MREADAAGRDKWKKKDRRGTRSKRKGSQESKLCLTGPFKGSHVTWLTSERRLAAVMTMVRRGRLLLQRELTAALGGLRTTTLEVFLCLLQTQMVLSSGVHITVYLCLVCPDSKRIPSSLLSW